MDAVQNRTAKTRSVRSQGSRIVPLLLETRPKALEGDRCTKSYAYYLPYQSLRRSWGINGIFRFIFAV
jgi:hypothetical protein